MSGINFLAGISTKDYVLLAADRACYAYGAIIVSDEQDKKFMLGNKLIMLCIGEDGDVAQFGDWTQRNIQLYKIRYGYEMSPRSCHHWIRRSIAKSLRTEDYYTVDTLIGGYDDYEQKAFLGSVDYLGNGVADQPYLFRGFSGRFCYSILDKVYRNDMSEEEGIAVLKKCLMESKRRFVANLPAFQMMIIDKNGFRQLEDVKL